MRDLNNKMAKTESASHRKNAGYTINLLVVELFEKNA
jgi:hypothetical protein